MALPAEPYFDLVVESFCPESTIGHRGSVHVRPVPGQGVDTSLYVECSREMTRLHAVGTRFLVKAKYSSRQGGAPFLKAPYAWGYTVVE